MRQSKRLRRITEMVTPGAFVFDVGCDHGYTAIALVANGICPGAVASDLREGPLRAAAENIAAAGLSGRITTVLTDGVPKEPGRYVPEACPVTLVITGMGGPLILRILSEAGEGLSTFSELVLGPQSEAAGVPQGLWELGFAVTDEQMVEEDGKFYYLLKARRREDGQDASTHAYTVDTGCETVRKKEELLLCEELKNPVDFGFFLLQKKDATYRRYLEKRWKTLTAIEASLLAGGDGSNPRLAEVREERNDTAQKLSVYD